MKIFISQPMKGKTKEEIEADSALACRLLELAGHEVLGGYQDNSPKTKHSLTDAGRAALEEVRK